MLRGFDAWIAQVALAPGDAPGPSLEVKLDCPLVENAHDLALCVYFCRSVLFWLWEVQLCVMLLRKKVRVVRDPFTGTSASIADITSGLLFREGVSSSS